MKRLVSMLFCIFCIAQVARAEQVTLAELKQQMPERLQMTVLTDTGETIEVDAPIVLPDGDQIPVVLVQRATFDLTDLHKISPLPNFVEKGSAYDAYTADDHPGAPILSLYAEEKRNRLTGKVDSTVRASLPQGEMPPENDVTVNDIMAFIYENIGRFDCDTTLDLRVEKATAKSGLYAMKKFKTPEGWTEYTINEKKPVKNGSKGIWHLDLAQYIHGARIFEDYLPYGSFLKGIPEYPNYWYSPLFLHVDYMDEKYHNIHIGAVKEIDILVEDTPLLSYEALVRVLETRMKEGKLQSIYALILGYTLKIVKGDPFFEDDYIGHRMDTRFVLVPEWEVLGFDQKNATDAKSVGLTAPTKEMILEPKAFSRYGLTYDVRLNASTGKFILDFESMEFDLSSFEYILDDIQQ